jgi:hypothetical protein
MKMRTEAQRISQTLKIMAAVDEWGLSGKQILSVLDMTDDTHARHLHRFRRDIPFPDIEQVNTRIIRLLGIIDALRTTYPRNLGMGARWMNMPHRRFKKRTPVNTILEDGETGVLAVLAELDCAYAWELSGSIRS